MVSKLYYKKLSTEFGGYDQFAFLMINFMQKIVLLAVFILTMGLSQKVLKSRIRLLSHAQLEPRGDLSDYKVVLPMPLALHSICFLVILVVHKLYSSKRSNVTDDNYMDSGKISNEWHQKMLILGECVALVRDFFLLPQIASTDHWQLHMQASQKNFFSWHQCDWCSNPHV
ncbi:hypothetical protein DsansV1_C11g0113191 [Dioscorea sansibarensis]